MVAVMIQAVLLVSRVIAACLMISEYHNGNVNSAIIWGIACVLVGQELYHAND